MWPTVRSFALEPSCRRDPRPNSARKLRMDLLVLSATTTPDFQTSTTQKGSRRTENSARKATRSSVFRASVRWPHCDARSERSIIAVRPPPAQRSLTRQGARLEQPRFTVLRRPELGKTSAVGRGWNEADNACHDGSFRVITHLFLGNTVISDYRFAPWSDACKDV